MLRRIGLLIMAALMLVTMASAIREAWQLIRHLQGWGH
jgi:hypothetical protein